MSPMLKKRMKLFESDESDELECENISYGPNVGDISCTQAHLWARADGPGVMVFHLESDRHTIIEKVVVSKANDYAGCVHVKRLYANTFYSVTVGNQKGSFTTFPLEIEKAPLKFLFSACIGGQGYGRPVDTGWIIFKAMTERNANFMLLMGDSIYADDKIESDGTGMFREGIFMVPGQEEICMKKKDFFARYRYHLDDEHYSNFLLNVPTFVMWDDHEILDDWGRAKLSIEEKTAAYMKKAREAFFSYWPLPHLSDKEPFRIYRKFRCGSNAEFFYIDCRQYRSLHKCKSEGVLPPIMRTMLGYTQKKWLKESVQNSTALWKIIVSTVPLSYHTGWPNPEITGYDSWADEGATLELLEIIDHFQEHNVKNLLFITSDVHFPSALSYDPQNTGDPAFYEFGAGPMSSLPLPPSTPVENHPLRPTVLYSEGVFGGDFHNFGEVEIEESGRVRYKVIDKQGEEHFCISLDPVIENK
eukprot:TRINITY_DN4413_c0_g1_i1.p1 TRINITY_DN4413_c0_g1~~TRINITY_DN4413_c0_g1_i1.p1  ORF type:complete len:514 (+),score=103.28 TRINITY_DN4413_c0_g1_i1:122-1543(+)